MPDSRFPLAGKTALVTGVSRRNGIGFAIARQLAGLGANLFVQHYAPHDADLPWGGDDLKLVRDGIRGAQIDGTLFGDASADLADASTLGPLMAAAVALTGRVDILVCNHARSGGDGSIFDMTADRLDGHWQVNARSTILLTRLFAEQLAPRRAGQDAGGAVSPAARGRASGRPRHSRSTSTPPVECSG